MVWLVPQLEEDSTSDIAAYLKAMHVALEGANFEAIAEHGDSGALLDTYRNYVGLLQMIPPEGFTEIHGAILGACEEIVKILQSSGNDFSDGQVFARLVVLAQDGAAAFSILEDEADRLGLGLRFKF